MQTTLQPSLVCTHERIPQIPHIYMLIIRKQLYPVFESQLYLFNTLPVHELGSQHPAMQPLRCAHISLPYTQEANL